MPRFSTLWKIASLLALLAIVGAVHAQPDRLNRLFEDGVKAYDENRLTDAITAFEALLQQGQNLPSVLFNLGNSYYRNGEVGRAIRAYREAQAYAPRDPDIITNLGMAAQTAGIALPAYPAWKAFFMRYSQREWLRLLAVSFWCIVSLCGLHIFLPAIRTSLQSFIILFLCISALGALGFFTQRAFRIQPEWVVVTPEQTGYSGPMDTTTALLALPEGSIVRQESQRGGWIEISQGEHRAWLPASSAQPVLTP